jgi:hypothetical protein
MADGPGPGQFNRGLIIRSDVADRARLSQDFMRAIQEDFATHGRKAVETLRETDPGAYLRVVASLLPKRVEVKSVVAEMTDAELNDKIRSLATRVLPEIQLQTLEITSDLDFGDSDSPEDPSGD